MKLMEVKINYIDTKNAGGKAKQDVSTIIERYNIENVYCQLKNAKNVIFKILNEIRKSLFISKIMKLDSAFIIQHPFTRIDFTTKRLIKLAKKRKVYLFIHDVETIRFPQNKQFKNEIKLFKMCEKIIVHTNSMADYLFNKFDISIDKMIILDCFDYLLDGVPTNNIKEYDVCFAGNLIKEKATFLYDDISWADSFKMILYGIGLSTDSFSYGGSFSSNELPNHLNGKFGLVWDGLWDESDENVSYKAYSKYNSPHKLSLYIAAGMPVIIWSKTAMADFVIKNNLGYVIDTLADLNKIDFNSYINFDRSIKDMQLKIINGEFTKKVIGEILNDLKK